MQPLPDKVNVLVLTRIRAGDAMERIRAVAPERLNVINVHDDFIDEMAREWSTDTIRRYGLQQAASMSEEEREALVRDAHVMFMSVPFPKAIVRRASSLRWAHFAFAGVSNLNDTDWWGAPATVTSSRSYTNTLPLAEMIMAATFMFHKRFDWALNASREHNFDPTTFPGGRLLAGRTMGIVGLGGIGAQMARLAHGAGMRVVATRRSAMSRQSNVDGVDVLYPASQLHEMLSEADFVAITTAWTPETEGLLDEAAFAAMKPGAYLMNVARGEIIDEDALVDALHSGKVAGAYLDVWHNDFADPPSAALQTAPNVVFTPHVGGRSDVPQTFAVDVFCSNLERFLKGEPLENVVDWARGY